MPEPTCTLCAWSYAVEVAVVMAQFSHQIESEGELLC